MPALLEFQSPGQVRARKGCCSCSFATALGAFAATVTAIRVLIRRS